MAHAEASADVVTCGTAKAQPVPLPASFIVVVAVLVLFQVIAAAPTPLYVVYQRQWGFTSTTLTLVFAVFVVVLLATLLTFGRLSDQLGRRPVLLGAIAVEAVAVGVFLFANRTEMLFVARITCLRRARAVRPVPHTPGLGSITRPSSGRMASRARVAGVVRPCRRTDAARSTAAGPPRTTRRLVRPDPDDRRQLAATAFLLRNSPHSSLARLSGLLLPIGTTLTLLGLLADSLMLSVVGVVAAGIGYGAAGQATFGRLGSLTGSIKPMQRGELFAFGYTVAYLAFSLPAVAAGYAATVVGLHATVTAYSTAVVAVGIAALCAQFATHNQDTA